MKHLVCLLICVVAAAAPPVRIEQSVFEAGAEGVPAGWATWAARDEIAPRTYVDQVHYRTHPGSLATSGNSNAAAYGGWEYTAPGISAGKWYRFTGYYRAEGVTDENLQIVSRIDWRTADGKRAGRPDYAYAVTREADWRRVRLDAPAPEQAAAAKIQLYLGNAPHGTVWWDDISIEEIPDPGPREVRVSTVNFRPGKRTGSSAATVAAFLEVVEREVPGDTDIILLPEGMTVVDTGKKYADVAEPVPGPTTAKLGKAARSKNAYLVAGVYEREGPAIYNTAVLLDRQGNVAGKYRKVYLPREEVEGGLTPGNDYPVFQTDFGKVGLMICWDAQYADPARGLALRGAEMILMPIWGGNETLGKARAIENQVFLVTSGYNYPNSVLDPDGEVLAIAQERGTVATATVDLNRRYVDDWLGWMRGRFMKELRLDVPTRP